MLEMRAVCDKWTGRTIKAIGRPRSQVGGASGLPHPAFSPDSRKVSLAFADDENRLWVGIVEI
ncbi:MAG: hypothetical protein K0R28_4616 [Paenibacillus sp.]|jgi:hypothetical protein|nr:hypothetical protein [Paenibacillus sp.]